MVNSYFDEKGHLKREIFIEDAKRLAEKFANDGLKHTALRHFFQKLRDIEFKLKRQKCFDSIKDDIYGLVPLAYYQYNRIVNNRRVIPESFKNFIEENVNLAVKSEENFRGFVEYLKSILAYSKEREETTEGRGRR